MVPGPRHARTSSRRSRGRLAAGCAALLLGATGCRATSELQRQEGSAPEPAHWQEIGRSVEGRALECALFGEGPLTVLVMASIHGDEAAGTPLVRELGRRLAEGPPWMRGRRVILLPEANPDGVAGRRRKNANGVDLNRNFPARNWRNRDPHGADPLSEPESRAIHDLILEHGVDRIVTFHQAANLLDYDGPGRALALAMAAVSPLAIDRMGARPGSLGSWAGVDHGVPTLTVELPRHDDHATPAELWERYGRMLVAAIRHPTPGPR